MTNASTFSRQHLLLHEGAPLVDVFADPEATIDYTSVTIGFDGAEFTVTAPAHDLLALARRIFDTVQRTTDQLGPECIYCHRRGINQDQFAQPHPYPSMCAHVGCAEDHRHMEDEATDLVRGEAWQVR